MTDTAADPTGVGAEPPDDREAARRRRHRARSLIEWAVVLLGALVLSLGMRAWVVQSFFIPSGSMEPTLEIDDRIVVNKLNGSLDDVARGDIVVFERPDGLTGQGVVKDLVKRVIAFPGETVEGHDGQVWIDGAALEEPWLPEGVSTADFGPVLLPEGTFWAMGDNRGNSSDSRVFGPVDADLLVGEAVLRIWPLDRAGGL